MTVIEVALGSRSYPVHIGSGLLGEVGAVVRARSAARRALLIADAGAAVHYAAPLLAALQAAGLTAQAVQVPAGEGSKCLARVGELYEAALDAQLERRDVIVALGGGVVGDLAGFVAATYLRGIDFVQVPTTLLAQVDASVGGKVGINLSRGKNLVGAFHQPRAVVADLDTLATLPERELRAGLAEVVKHGVIRDADYFAFVEDQAEALLQRQLPALDRAVQGSVQIKAAVVAADEREGGVRAHLNFGHTVGHGIEAALGYGQWLHGEAVAVGMLVATRLAAASGCLQQGDLGPRLEALLTRLGLPAALPKGVEPAAVLRCMAYDKKAAGGRLRWVLPVGLGTVTVVDDVAETAVAAVLAQLAR